MSIKALCIGISGGISFRCNNMESDINIIYKVSDLILIKFVDVDKMD